jgi:hypothetical protein
MTRRLTCVLVCVCVLAPSSARADDGGWLDWLYRLDAKLWGLNTEIHFLCLDQGKTPVACEKWFGIPTLLGRTPDSIQFERIKHEFNVRVGVYWKYGDIRTVNSARQEVTLGGDEDGLWATKLMATYTYLPDRHIEVNVGAGLMHFRGSALVEPQSSAILTPIGLVYVPGGLGSRAGTVFLRGEASYITHSLTPNVFRRGAPGNGEGEWNVSFGVGIDLRRR